MERERYNFFLNEREKLGRDVGSRGKAFCSLRILLQPLNWPHNACIELCQLLARLIMNNEAHSMNCLHQESHICERNKTSANTSKTDCYWMEYKICSVKFVRYLCGFCSIVEMNKVIDANQTICMYEEYDMVIFAANLTVQADCSD